MYMKLNNFFIYLFIFHYPTKITLDWLEIMALFRKI